MRRWLASIFLTALVAGLIATTAAAALFLTFSRTIAAPRDLVAVRTAGAGMMRSIPRSAPPLRVFLAPAAAAEVIRSPRDRRLIPLGALRRDRKQNGRLSFRVPNVPPGDYTTFIHCVPCGPLSDGRTVLPAGPFTKPFRIVEAAPWVRDCAASVDGQLPSDWRDRAVIVGPLALIGFEAFAGAPPSRFARLRGTRRSYEPVKILALVQGDAAVTLSVPLSERSVVGLLYRPSAFNTKTVTAADAAVTLHGCPGGPEVSTQFNGGFVVAGARCAALDVRLAGEAQPMRLELPFGKAC